MKLYMSAVLVAVMLVLVLCIPVLAHHGRGGTFLGGEENLVTMKATVAEWVWINPHTFMVFDAAEEDGSVVRWRAEASSVTTMMGRHDLRRNSFKPGDEVNVTVVPARNGTPIGLLYSIVDSNGAVVFSDPRRATQALD